MTEERRRGLLSDMRPTFAPGTVIRFDQHELTKVVDYNSGVLDIVSPLDDPEQQKPAPPTLVATVLSFPYGEEPSYRTGRLYSGRTNDRETC